MPFRVESIRRCSSDNCHAVRNILARILSCQSLNVQFLYGFLVEEPLKSASNFFQNFIVTFSSFGHDNFIKDLFNPLQQNVASKRDQNVTRRRSENKVFCHSHFPEVWKVTIQNK